MSIYIPRWFILVGVIGLFSMIALLYLEYVLRSRVAQSDMAEIAMICSFGIFLYSTTTIAAASSPRLAIWPARYTA